MRCGRPLASGTEEYCFDCRRKKSYIRQGRSLWLHREPVSGALYRFKYHNRRRWGKVFAGELNKSYGEQLKKWGAEAIIPVPLHISRRRKRGFNQAEVIAEELSRLTGIPMRNDVLFRIRKTAPQKDLGSDGRKKNLSGAFGVSRTWKPVENAVLIDDIYTTGSTVEKAAEVLAAAGVQNVFFLTISIGQGI